MYMYMRILINSKSTFCPRARVDTVISLGEWWSHDSHVTKTHLHCCCQLQLFLSPQLICNLKCGRGAGEGGGGRKREGEGEDSGGKRLGREVGEGCEGRRREGEGRLRKEVRGGVWGAGREVEEGVWGGGETRADVRV